MGISVFRRKNCRLCQSEQTEQVLSLNPTPLANAFVPKEQVKEAQPLFPLDLHLCTQCKHVQLLDVVDPKALFEHYVYVSGTSPVFVNHFRSYAQSMVQDFGVKPSSLVVEIGSNDGTLLRFFKDQGMQVLGVDPARNIAQEATRSGIETWPEFFSSQISKKIKNERGSAKLVTANNVFAHADDLRGIAEAVRDLLAQDGLFVIEVSYLLDVFQKTLFDTIYHEHVSYHSVGPLQTFFKSLGMQLIDAIRIDPHGGSIRCVAQKQGGPYSVSPRVEELIQLESEVGLYSSKAYTQLARQISDVKQQLGSLLRDLKGQGKRIAGYGAPAKATTLMYQFEMGADLIEYIIDDSPLKQGLYSPGLHIPVVSSQALAERRPEYLVVLAWNFADPIIRKLSDYSASGGKFVVPLPQVEVK